MVDEFELFSAETCDAKLPVNPIVDQFTFVRFARLRQLVTESPSGMGPSVVLPRDVVNPWLAEHLRKELFYYPPDFVKGGVGLKADWDVVIDPPQESLPLSATDDVEIRDLGSFFTDKTVQFDGRDFKVEVTDSLAKDLRTLGTAVTVIGEGDQRKIVTLHANPAITEDGGTIASPGYVGELDAFLANPSVLLGGDVLKVQLSEDNIRDLTAGGVTQVTAGEGGASKQIFITSELGVGLDIGGGMVGTGGGPGVETLGGGVGIRTVGTGIGTTRSALTATPYGGTKSIAKTEGTPLSTGQVNQLVSQGYMENLEFVLFLPYRQTWTLKGYSRGELLNTISLAPEEETTIEVFSWDRYLQSREEITTIEQESSFEFQLSDKHSHEIVKELTKDSGWSFNIGGGVTLPAGDVPVDIQAGYDTSESVRDFSRDTRSHVTEAVQRASARFKSTHQTKVTETHEFGSETRTTRKIRNPNMCHTLNLDYFEVQGTYDVETVLDVSQTRLCVLTTQFLSGPIDDPDFMLAHEHALREALLAPSLYTKAFDALHTLKAWDAICDVKCKTHCPCEVVKKTEDPKDTGGGDTTAKQIAAATEQVKKAAQALRDSIQAIRGGSVDQICSLARDVGKWARYTGLAFWNRMSSEEAKQYEADWETAKTSYHRWAYTKAMEVAVPRFWHSAADYLGANDDTPEALQRFLASAEPSLVDVLNIASAQARLGATVLSSIIELVKAKCINLKPLADNFSFDHAQLDGAFAQARSAMEAYKQATAITVNEPEPSDEAAAVAAAKAVQQATTEWSNKEIAQAKVEVDALRAHLRTNESFYRQAIWKRMDPSDRFVALLTMGDLLDYVDTQVLGFVGNRAALAYRIERDRDLTTWFDTNVVKNRDLTTLAAPVTVTLPTGGVTLDGRLGDCDLCEEYIAEHRAMDLAQKSTEVDITKERLAQEKLETSRRDQRLKQTPPLLDSPVPAPTP
jgi:hypothetical protein